jgi:hypothetical protein
VTYIIEKLPVLARKAAAQVFESYYSERNNGTKKLT